MQMAAKGGVALAQISEPTKNETHNETFAGLDTISMLVNSVNYKNVDTWKNQVMQTTQYGEPFLRFTLCFIITFGAILKLIY
jgi:hypothetical protein